MNIFIKLSLLASFGACGTLCRYGIAVLCTRFFGADLPLGTLSANLLGCFLFGVVTSLASVRGLISPELRQLLLVGFLGAFTTFSSLIFDSHILHNEKGLILALLNVLGQSSFGFLFFWLGAKLFS